MTQKYVACAPDGISRVVRYPMRRVQYSPHGLKYETFDVGEEITADDLAPWTNIAALLAGGHLRLADDTAAPETTEKKEAV